MLRTAFIHGFLGQPSDWDNVLQHFDGDSDAITIPDAQSWDQTVQLVLEQLPSEVDLVGYSMGGRIAIGCAVMAPNRIRRLVVVSANPGVDESERSSRLSHDVNVAKTLRESTSESDRRSFLDSWYRQPVFAGLADAQIEELIQRRAGIDIGGMAHLIETLSVAVQPDYRDALPAISAETKFIAGDRDQKYATIAKAAARLSTRISCEIIQDCGHVIPFEAPKTLSTTINHFLNR